MGVGVAALDAATTGVVVGDCPLGADIPGASERGVISGLPTFSSAFGCCFFCSADTGTGAGADFFAALSRNASAFLSASSSESSARGAPLVRMSMASSTLPSVIIRALRDTRDGKPISTILVTINADGRYEVLILGSLDGSEGAGVGVGAGAPEVVLEEDEVSAVDRTEEGTDPVTVDVDPASDTFFWGGKGCWDCGRDADFEGVAIAFATMAGDPMLSEGDDDDIDNAGDETAILVEAGCCVCGCCFCGCCCGCCCCCCC